jgi:hypothetical protein
MLDDICVEAKGFRTMVHVEDDYAPKGMLLFEDLIAQNARCEDGQRGGEALAGLFYTVEVKSFIDFFPFKVRSCR